MQRAIAELTKLRSKSRRYLIIQSVARLFAWTLIGLILLGVSDYVLRFPSAVRMFLLIAGLVAIVTTVWRQLIPALRFEPSLTQLALRVERAMPGLRGRLASSVEFAAAGLDAANPLAARTVRETDHRMNGDSVGRVLQHKRTWREGAIFLGAILVITGTTLASPQVASTAVQRILMPYSTVQWPARTGVSSLMHKVVSGDRVHPRGTALPLRAAVTKGSDDQTIEAQFRMLAGGMYSEWQRIVLTHQGEGIHERLVDTNGDGIELFFESEDASTQREQIRLVSPPSIRASHIDVQPPSYAAPYVQSFEAQLGPGTDDRSVTERTSLAGSHVTLTLELTKSIPVPTGPADLRQTLGWDDSPLPTLAVVSSRPERWVLSWSLRQTRQLSLELKDEYGLPNSESISYRIRAVEDRPLVATITEPAEDETVTASAIVPLTAEVQDDVAVEHASLIATVQSASMQEPEQQPRWSQHEQTHQAEASISADINMAELMVAEGDTVIVTAIGQDVYDIDGTRHDPVSSMPRRLRILSELDLMAELHHQFAVVRQNAIRIETMQADLQDNVIENSVQPGASAAQGRLGERIAEQHETLDAIERRAERNQIHDPQIDNLIEQARDMVNFAGRASNQATSMLEQREQHSSEQAQSGDPGEAATGEDEKPSAGEPREVDKPIANAQQDVRDELTDLIKLLDQNQDTWVITQQVRELLQRQQRLAEETHSLARQTVGRRTEELTEGERSDMQRIAEAQRDLAEKAREVTEEARERAGELAELDPAAAEGLRNAATTAEREQVNQTMESAAQQASQNQLSNAQSDQQAAAETLSRMLDQIEQTSQAEAAELARRLQSLVESITRLVTIQENELGLLNEAEQSGDFLGRDSAMIRLNQNTTSVATEARAAGQTTRQIARDLDRAADAQGAAVTALRDDPMDVERARDGENESLERLKEALQLAEEAQQQAQQEETRKRREEVIRAYRELLQREVSLRKRTLDVAALDEIDRRATVELRRQALEQTHISEELETLSATNNELREDTMFSYVHQLIHDWSGKVSEALNNADPGVQTTDRQYRIADSLGRLVEALEEAQPQAQEFADQQSGEGGPSGEGAGGQQGLLPPVSQLKLLRGMQEQVYHQTRAADDHTQLTDVQLQGRLTELGEQQRDIQGLAQDMIESLQNGSAPTPDFDTSDVEQLDE